MRSKFSSSWVHGLALCLALAASAWPAASRAAGMGPSGTITLNVCTLPSASATQCYTTATLKLSANYFNCVWLTNPTELVGCTVGNWTSYVWLGTSQRYLELRTHTGGQPDGSDASRTAGTLLDSELAVAKAYNLSPSIAFAAPANGSTVLGGTPIVLAATASDPDGGVSKVEFWRDSTKLGDGIYVAANNRYEYSWSGAATGSHSLRAIAYDNVSAPSPWASLSISVNYPPQANLNAPAPNTTVQEGAIVAMQAGASDPDSPLAKVELLVDGVVVATKTASPYTHNWTAVGGSHVLSAKAYDQRGPVATSNAVPITVNRKPSAWISSPAANANVPSGQPISLTASVSDPDAGDYISQVEFYTATTLIARLYSPPFSATYNNAEIGAHDIYVRAFDARGGFHEAPPHRINVTQLPPGNVSLTSHANGATIQQPGNVTLTGHAHDPEGQAMTLRFYDGTTLIGADSSAPYAATWSSPSAGTHSLRVEATDAAGATTVSASVSVYVNAPPGVTIEAPLATPARSFGQPVDIVVAASDSDGIQKVELFGDSTKLTEVTASADGKFRHAWTNVAAGSRTLRARAWDQRGGYRDASVTFRVNTVPNVSITAPTGAPPAPLVGSNLTIQAGASDDGTVTQVDFYIDGALRGSDYGSPYTYSWAGIPAGTHQLVAKAKDNDGAWGTSATVTVFVNTPPVATLGVSANPIEFGLPLTLTASGTDATGEGTIKLAEILDGDTVIASAPADTVSVTRSNFTRGVHALSARVTDRDDAVHRSAVTEVTILQQSPTVSLNLTHEQRFLYGPNIPISATASDPDGSIQKVEFFDNGTWFGTATTGSPYSVTWQIPSVGRRTITALATDNEGGTKMSAPVTVIVNAAPALTQFAATPVVPLDGSVALSVRAVDPDGGSIKSVRFLRNGVAVPGTVARSGDDYSMQWTGNPYGTYSFVAEATDNYDTVATSAPKTVKVNRAPTGQFVGDVADGWVQHNSDVEIAVDADDADGSVSVVEFYVDGTPLGTAGVSSGVARREWARVGAGTREVKAVIVDSDGARTTITTQVTTNVPPAVALAASPASGLKEGDDLTLTATVSDHNGGVVAVKFYEGETLLGEASSTALAAQASGTVSYTIDNITRGSHTYTARARDERGSETPSEPVTVSASQPGPTIVWKQPTPERPAVVYGEQALFSVDATDPDGVASVTFVVDGMMRATDYAPANGIGDNHFVHIEPPRLGMVPVYAIGLDTEDAVSESNRFDIKVHRRPIVHIVSPEKDAEFESGIDAIDFQITVTDDYGVESIYVKHPGATFIRENPPRCPGSTDTYCISSRSDGPHDGVHYIEVRATDVDGAESRLFRQRYCVGMPCEELEVTLVSPKAGARGPGKLLLAAETNTNGTIAYVEFFDDTLQLGGDGYRDTQAPYELELDYDSPGAHRFRARAVTQAGTEAYSDWVDVQIVAGGNRFPKVDIMSPPEGLELGEGDSISVVAQAIDSEIDGAISSVAMFAIPVQGGTPIEFARLEFEAQNPLNLYFGSFKAPYPGAFRFYAVANDDQEGETRSKASAKPAIVAERKDGLQTAGSSIAVTPESEYQKHIKAGLSSEMLDAGLFGDRTSLYTGATEFQVTDIDIPGNGLPLQFSRRFQVEDRRGRGFLSGFSDWEPDVPYIRGTFPASRGWVVGSTASTARCNNTSDPSFEHPVFEIQEIWQGNMLHLPGGGESELLVNDNPQVRSKTGEGFPWVTSDLVRISCLDELRNGEGEGFVAETADGLRYRFDWMIERPTSSLKKQFKIVGDAPEMGPQGMNDMYANQWSVWATVIAGGVATSTLETFIEWMPGTDGQYEEFGSDIWSSHRVAREEVYLVATEVADRFGNKITYQYEGDRLISISASDGRKVRLQYDSDDRISTATATTTASNPLPAQERVWTYIYDEEPADTLKHVVLPTHPGTPDSRWTYTHHTSLLGSVDADLERVDGEMPCLEPPPPSGTYTFNATHPSGATSSFTFDYLRHYRTISSTDEPPTNCVEYSNLAASSRLRVPNYFDAWTLRKKTLATSRTPGVVDEWTFGYGGNVDWFMYDMQPSLYGCDESNGECRDRKTVLVKRPDGSYEASTFGTRHKLNEGWLLQSEVLRKKPGAPVSVAARSAGETQYFEVVQKTDWNYVTKRDLLTGTYPFAPRNTALCPSATSTHDYCWIDFHGSSTVDFSEHNLASKIRPLRSVITRQDGVDFTQENKTWDGVGRPLMIRQASVGVSPGDYPLREKTSSIGYFDWPSQPSKDQYWHFGRVASVSDWIDGVLKDVDVTQFNPATGLPKYHYTHERRDREFTWNGQGQLEEIVEGSFRTKLLNYHRGIPREIHLPDGADGEDGGIIEATVSDFGEVTAVKDQEGRETVYRYDALGRIRRIVEPVDAANPWYDTVIDYSRLGSDGFWTREEKLDVPVSNGVPAVSRVVGTTDLDGRLRAVEERQFDLSSGKTRVLTRAYDHANRLVFESYPAFIGDAGAGVRGVDSVYDELGRAISVSRDSELGELQLQTEYVRGLRSVTTDPEGYQIRTQYWTLGSPSYELASRISRPPMANPTDSPELDGDDSPDSMLTVIDRDLYGKPLSITRSGRWQGANMSQTRQLAYDEYERLCVSHESETGAMVVGYDDAEGLVAWRTRGQPYELNCATARSGALGEAIHYGYGAGKRLTSVDHQTSADIKFVYYRDGRLKEASTLPDLSLPSTLTKWTYQYNTKGQLDLESLSVARSADLSDTEDFVFDWTYDRRGFLSGLVQGSLGIDFAPDVFGRPTKAGSHVQGATYYPNGGIAGYTLQNNVARAIGQNDRGMVSSILDARIDAQGNPSGHRFLDLGYTYDGNGNVGTVSDGLKTGAGAIRSFGYDAFDRLVSSMSIDGIAETFDYDPLDNIRRISSGAVVHNIGYSARFHPCQKSESAIDPNAPCAYEFDAFGQIASKISGIGSQDFDFDESGRLVRITHGTESHRDEAYLYDAHGRRVRTIYGPSADIRFDAYTRDGLLRESRDDTSGDAVFHYLGKQLVAKASNEGVEHPHADALGSPLLWSAGASNDAIRPASYSPYGKSALDQRAFFGFTGHASDGLTGLTYMQQRYYDPEIGRFLSSDPVEWSATNGGNFNRYWYANNNPLSFLDPDGRDAVVVASLLWGKRLMDADDPLMQFGSDVVSILCGCDASYVAPTGSGELQSTAAPWEIAVPGSAALMMPVRGLRQISPHLVRFSQDSIKATFKDGRSLKQLVDALKSGALKPNQVEPIRLFWRDGKLFTLDNRRLEAFRRADVKVPYRMATEKEIADEGWKFTTRNEGISVRVRGEQ